MKLSIVVPCYNERDTLRECIAKVMGLANRGFELEIVLVDDGSSDGSAEIAADLARECPLIRLLRHDANQGKGSALRTGIAHTTGDFVAVQDADLEYDPLDLLRLLEPLQKGKADVVFGSRFLSPGRHRVLYFWHSLANSWLTFLSNMLTDLNLTDMAACYKVFRGEVLRSIELEENRFAFDAEITAKVAVRRLRVYEIGISYDGRTYAQGKKIGAKDGLRALYSILKYNLPTAPLPIQFLMYLFVGGVSALANLALFLGLRAMGVGLWQALFAAFFSAAAVNYLLSVSLLFRSGAKWERPLEILNYTLLVCAVALFDASVTYAWIQSGMGEGVSKALASAAGLIMNFLGRKYLIFYQKPAPDWER